MKAWRDLDDRQLIQAAQKGEAEAYGELYERYAENIFRFVFSHVSGRLDAEDLTEEVFLRVWRNLHNYREQGVPFLAYLFRVARSVVIDHYRSSAQKQAVVSIEEVALHSQEPGPSESLLQQADYDEVRAAITDLREDYRMVLMLRFWAGLSPTETAQVMNRSDGAIRVLQFRALNALRLKVSGIA